jgi:hypothetical protein
MQQHARVPLRRVRAGELRWEKFLYELKAGRQRYDAHRGAGLTAHSPWTGSYVQATQGGRGQVTLDRVETEYRHVGCGDTITTDTTLESDLVNCPNNGIVIGADNITLDLNGHTPSMATAGGSTPAPRVRTVTSACSTGLAITG